MNAAQLGLALYLLSIGVDAWLLARLLRRREFRQYPLFTAFIAFVAVKGFLSFALLTNGQPGAYAAIYRVSRPIVYALTIAIAAEALRHAYRSVALERTVQFAAVVPAGLLLLHFSLEMEGWVKLGVAAIALACAPQIWRGRMPERAIGVMLGVFASELLPWIVSRPAVIVALPVSRFVPTLSFLLALAIWLHYFRLQPSRSEALR